MPGDRKWQRDRLSQPSNPGDTFPVTATISDPDSKRREAYMCESLTYKNLFKVMFLWFIHAVAFICTS